MRVLYFLEGIYFFGILWRRCEFFFGGDHLYFFIESKGAAQCHNLPKKKSDMISIEGFTCPMAQRGPCGGCDVPGNRGIAAAGPKTCGRASTWTLLSPMQRQ